MSPRIVEKYPWTLNQMHHLQDDPEVIKLIQ
jgi:hypothetical protein